MATENEVRVLDVLSGFEIPEGMGPVIEGWGTDAVTVVCEAALGTYSSVRPKVRYNAVAMLGAMSHPQAKETVHLLITDPSSDVSIRAMRAAAQQRNELAVDDLGRVLTKPDLPPVVAAEAVKALNAIGSTEARAALTRYAASTDEQSQHRRNPLVMKRLAAAGYRD
jgi:HEAT repeat protein